MQIVKKEASKAAAAQTLRMYKWPDTMMMKTEASEKRAQGVKKNQLLISSLGLLACIFRRWLHVGGRTRR